MPKYILTRDLFGKKAGEEYWSGNDALQYLLLKDGVIREKVEFEVVHSDRIDYCGSCKKNHGYECPKDKEVLGVDIKVDPKMQEGEWKLKGYWCKCMDKDCPHPHYGIDTILDKSRNN